MDVPAEAREHLETAYLALAEAHLIWGCWADEVRQQTEKRLGVGITDERVLDDAEYGAALDAGRPYSDAVAAVADALTAIDPRCAEARREGRLTAFVRERRLSAAKSAPVHVHPRRAPLHGRASGQ